MAARDKARLHNKILKGGGLFVEVSRAFRVVKAAGSQRRTINYAWLRMHAFQTFGRCFATGLCAAGAVRALLAASAFEVSKLSSVATWPWWKIWNGNGGANVSARTTCTGGLRLRL